MDKLWAAEPGATERKSRQVETLSSQHRGMVAHGIRVVGADGVTLVAAPSFSGLGREACRDSRESS